ncbi:MAG: calcium-binding protein [Pseudomonadota bacterium]
MTINIVDSSTDDVRFLSSVDVKFSGFHLGGGVYFSANHVPTPGGASTAIAQRSLDGEGEMHETVELDYTLPGDPDTWNSYFLGPTVDLRYDMSLHIGSALPDCGFYHGPSIGLLIAMNPDELAGNVTITGYPKAENSLNGEEGVLHASTANLVAGNHYEGSINGDAGGAFILYSAQVLGGMSGGATFLEYDADGDGVDEFHAIGTISRATPNGAEGLAYATSFSAHYAKLAAALEALEGEQARSADDFARNTLLSGQAEGSSFTTVQGTFFHEDLFGSLNQDTLLGAGGEDRLVGREGDDWLEGGAGGDILEGGAGRDLASYAQAQHRVYADLEGRTVAKGEAKGDQFDSVEGLLGSAHSDRLRGDAAKNLLIGGAGDDRLFGRKGSDVLDGGEGDDHLFGNAGQDVLLGGDGADTFVYFRADESRVGYIRRDIIKDFEIGQDRIDLSRLAGEDFFVFIGEGRFSGQAGEIFYHKAESKGFTVLHADLDGDGRRDFQIELSGLLDLEEEDLIL